MKRLIMAVAAVAMAGCMVTTVSKDYSADDVESSARLRFNKVDDLDKIETFDKSAIPVVVKVENKKEQLYSSDGIHGLLWLCTLGIVPSWQTEAETHTVNVVTPLGKKSGICTMTKRQYWGWVPYMLPFGASEQDASCEDELLSRLVSQYKQEWTAENVEKMNVAKSAHLKEFRAKADSLLAQKKYAEVISICRAEKNKVVVSEYMSKALRGAVDVALEKKDYQRVVNLCRYAKNDPELQSKRREAIVNLIAFSADEAAFCNLMKKYGEVLSVSQIAAAGEKATNAVVKAKIAEWQKSVTVAADKKIETEIMVFIKGKILEHKKKVEEEKRKKGHCSFRENYEIGKDDVKYLAKLLARINSSEVLCHVVDILLNNKVDAGLFYFGSGNGGWDEVYETEFEMISGLKEDFLVALLGMDSCDKNVKRHIIDRRITSPEVLFRLAVNEKGATWQYRGSSVGERALAKINDKTTLVRIALLAVNNVVSRQAEKKVGDKKAIVDGMAELLSAKKISEPDVERHVKLLNDDEASIALYNAAKGRTLKQLIFSKLATADRNSIREGNVAKCKQLIDAAKVKGKDTFEMGGFYLGMDIADVDMLIGYYFPDWSTEEGYDDDDKKEVRAVWVPQQGSAFCRADKNGKVWQLNFGKNILKKFCKYDVQDEQEWVQAYSREHGIDMKYVYLHKETTLADMSGNFDVTTYKAWLNQKTWQWKNNAKGYRLVYFGERDIVTAHENIVKKFAASNFRGISADAGVLRATVEND